MILHKWIGRYPLPFPKSDHPIWEIRTVLLLWSLAVILPILKIFVFTPRLNNFIDARFLLELFYLPVNAVIYVAIPLFFVVRRDKWSATDQGNRSKTSFWLENSRITFVAPVDSMFRAKISGSASHDEYLAYNQHMDPFREASRASYQRLSEIKQNGSEAEIHRGQVIADSVKAVELNATLEYIKSHPVSFVGASMLKSAAYYLT
ncbi:MAG: DUF4369 domain-containing protein [Bacteroidales bacterium]|nr:DUF4369 domain-containing protein [Bacteroidales bacterium]